eukprot:1789875-Rhodomonas_salina.1
MPRVGCRNSASHGERASVDTELPAQALCHPVWRNHNLPARIQSGVNAGHRAPLFIDISTVTDEWSYALRQNRVADKTRRRLGGMAYVEPGIA